MQKSIYITRDVQTENGDTGHTNTKWIILLMKTKSNALRTLIYREREREKERIKETGKTSESMLLRCVLFFCTLSWFASTNKMIKKEWGKQQKQQQQHLRRSLSEQFSVCFLFLLCHLWMFSVIHVAECSQIIHFFFGLSTYTWISHGNVTASK